MSSAGPRRTLLGVSKEMDANRPPAFEPPRCPHVAPSVTAWAHTAFPELKADRSYHQPGDDSPLTLLGQAIHSVGRVVSETALGLQPAMPGYRKPRSIYWR